MRVPSRQMPAPENHTIGRIGGLLACVLFLAILTSPGLIWWPLAFLLPTVFLVVTFFDELRSSRIAEARRDYSICNFARSFDCRVIDTWVIRAVFEELSLSYPVRPDDNLADDLGIVDEDLDDTFEDIAKRIGRSTDELDIEANPMYDKKVETVRDLVIFLQHQRKLGFRENGNG